MNVIQEQQSQGELPPLKRISWDEAKDKYHITGIILGQGAFGIVKRAKNRRTGEDAAVKMAKSDLEYKAQSEAKAGFNREAELLHCLSHHQNIIKLLDYVEGRKDNALVLEFAETTLSKHIDNQKTKKLTEWQARGLFQQIVSALNYCHEKDIAHRDIKLDNILLNGTSTIKLADFGLAKRMIQGGKLHTICGTREYVAPEVMEGKPYGLEVDIWSCGVVLYRMLVGNLQLDKNKTPVGDVQLDMQKGFSPAARDLIRRMLTVEPGQRITVTQILTHPWFDEHHAQSEVPSKIATPARPIRPNSQRALEKFVVADGFFTGLQVARAPVTGKIITIGNAGTEALETVVQLQ